MPDEPLPADGPAPDPFEAELVAYLDGELDPTAARRVEARLASDPAARAKAALLKKSFDLLDYLPRPDPSPTFTTRTLEKLPTIQPRGAGDSGPAPHPASPAAARPQSGAASSSVPVPLESGPLPAPARHRRGLWVLGAAGAAFAFAALGYLATAAVRPHLFPAPPREPEPKVEADARVVERLPLYAVADDLPFVRELARPELFGDEPAVAYDPTLRVPPVEGDKPTGPQFEALAKSFRELPAARRAEVVLLDAQLHALEARERERLLRVLEVYAAWLDRLPDAERRGVLAAATPGLRLGVVRDLRERQWVVALPPPLRKKLDALTDPNEKARLVGQWKDEEAIRRDRWAFVRRHAEAFADNKSPWPFDTEAGRNEVVEFARVAFKPDEGRRCRLSPEELAEYRRTLKLARDDGAWAWYGLTVYELARLHPYLPEPADPKLLVTEVNDLPEVYAQRVLPKKGPPRVKLTSVGKWPEFPLEVLKDVPFPKGFSPPALGPARLSEFKEPVRAFASRELFPKLTAGERFTLQKLEGRWPDYPRALVDYAAKYDMSVPGVTLPGPPKKWDATYGLRPGRP